MVLLQGGVNLFQGEYSTPTGWLDKPLGICIRFIALLEHRPAGDRCGRAQRNVDIVESRRNGHIHCCLCADDGGDDALLCPVSIQSRIGHMHVSAQCVVPVCVL